MLLMLLLSFLLFGESKKLVNGKRNWLWRELTTQHLTMCAYGGYKKKKKKSIFNVMSGIIFHRTTSGFSSANINCDWVDHALAMSSAIRMEHAYCSLRPERNTFTTIIIKSDRRSMPWQMIIYLEPLRFCACFGLSNAKKLKSRLLCQQLNK